MLGNGAKEARHLAYSAAAWIELPGAQMRRDIAASSETV